MPLDNHASEIQLDTITIRPMAMTIGAEIHGIDLTKPLKDAAVEEIWQALVDWKVVFFRDQSMDNDAFIAMSRQFGDLTPGHHVYGGHKKWNELYWVAKDRRKTRGSGELLYLPWQGWHTDVTPAINPPKVSILRGEIVPPYGGDTMWTDLNAAYEALSPVMREFIDGLRGVHYYAPKAGIKPNKDYLDQMKDNLIITEHPLVRVHPESGKRVLYISPTFLHEIKGLSPTESTALLDLLKTHAVRPEFTVRFKWEPGSIAMWDNRSTAHMAPRDIWASDFDRDFYRTTLVGDVPVGVDGEESTAIEGKPLVAA